MPALSKSMISSYDLILLVFLKNSYNVSVVSGSGKIPSVVAVIVVRIRWLLSLFCKYIFRFILRPIMH